MWSYEKLHAAIKKASCEARINFRQNCKLALCGAMKSFMQSYQESLMRS